MVLLILFLVACAVLTFAIAGCLVSFVSLAFQKRKRPDPGKARKRVVVFGATTAASLVLAVGIVALSQATATTPPLLGQDGKPLDGSIAELSEIELNGRTEWISIRGEDLAKPVLLFLAGGPGGSQMAAVRYELPALESDFVVVNWDQPGSGKSYSAMPIEELTPAVYVEDGIALAEYLCERFDQESIYLVGESWGSALGVFMAAERPDLFHAFIGTGQMVDFLETELIDYELALRLAQQSGDAGLVATLQENGRPPYYGSDVTWKSAAYLNYLGDQMARNPEISNGGYNTLRDLASEEYGLWDKLNYVRGIIDTFNTVYPQLYDTDLREQYAVLETPVYFLLGRHDINAPTALVEDYVQTLGAPAKEIVWFEHSGHSPWINERELFAQTVKEIADKTRNPESRFQPGLL